MTPNFLAEQLATRVEVPLIEVGENIGGTDLEEIKCLVLEGSI